VIGGSRSGRSLAVDATEPAIASSFQRRRGAVDLRATFLADSSSYEIDLPSTLEGKGSKGIRTMTKENLNLIQGTLDILVLKALAGGARHGYGVARWIRDTTDDALQVEEGALYTSLHRLEKKKWLKSEWGLSENNRRAKFYSLTPTGRRHLEVESKSWARYAEAVFKVLGAPVEGVLS
jgi:transcriptional regulator